MPYHLPSANLLREFRRVNPIRDTPIAAVCGHRPDIAVCFIGDGQQAGQIMVATCNSTPAKYCQPVRLGIAAILRRDLLVAQFVAQTAHVAQSTRPNQSFTALRGTVIFTRQILDLGQRQPEIR